MAYGMLNYHNETVCIDMRLVIAEAYQKLGQYDSAYETLSGMPWDRVSAEQTMRLIAFMGELYVNSGTVPKTLVTAFWDGVREESTSGEGAGKRTDYFLKSGAALFDYTEEGKSPWKVFLPLQNSCILGKYAALWDAETPKQADELLRNIEDITGIPKGAFIHALKIGAEFPITDRTLNIEIADVTANKLAADNAFLREAAIFASEEFESDDDLNWARALALIALQCNDWQVDADPQPLLRAFVRIESTFLTRCYSGYALENSDWLPPMHRFALHLVNAFTVLAPSAVSPEFTLTETAGIRGALAELKEAVKAVPEQKAVVDIILDALSGDIG